MSRFNFLAVLPLFAVLGLSPMELETKVASRSIAMSVDAEYPRYVARSSKIDRSKIIIESDLDLTCFSEKGEAYQARLAKEVKDFKTDVLDKDDFEAQKGRVQSLVLGLVDLEENYKALKEKKAFEEGGQEAAETTIEALKLTLDSLLGSEIEGELAYYKELAKPKPEPVVVKEEPKKEEKKEEKKSEASDEVCELRDKNKVLTTQVSELVTQQKTIMETMLGMNNLLVQMSQQQQSMQSRLDYQQRYPTLPSQSQGGSWIYYPQSVTPQMIYGQQPQQQPQYYQPYQQPAQMQQPSQQSYMGQQTYNQPMSQYDLQFSQPQPVVPGNFGSSPFNFNFSQTPANKIF